MTKPETIATIKAALQGDVTPEQLAIWRTDVVKQDPQFRKPLRGQQTLSHPLLLEQPMQ